MSIKLNNYRLQVTGKTLFRTEELVIEKGGVNVLLGDNGAGKTTLFRSILGIGGELIGEDGSSWSPIEGAYVGTNRPQLQYLSVGDYLSFGATAKTEKMQEVLQRKLACDFESFQAVKQLSDGEFKKLAIIRQLSFDPSVIFLDEPTAYLDVKNKDILGAFLKQESKHRLMILSTHDLHFAGTYGQNCYKIEQGMLSKVRTVK